METVFDKPLDKTVSNIIKFKEYSVDPTVSFSVWKDPLYYCDLTVTLPNAITNQNRLFAISHNNQHFVVSITGTNGSDTVSIRIASLTTAYPQIYLTILYV